MRNSMLLALSLLAGLCGCGGFYVVSERSVIESSQGSKVEQLQYITATIDLKNRDAIHSATFADSRDGDLSRLFVYASYTNPAFGDAAARSIPLYLVDLENGTVDSTSGAELISRLPQFGEARGSAFITIKTQALKKSDLSVILDVWNASKSLVETATSAAAGSKQVLEAVNTTTQILEKLAIKEYTATASLKVPQNLEQEHYAQVFLLLPTDRTARLNEVAQAELTKLGKTPLSTCRKATGAYACRNDQEYLDFPYIIVDYSLSAYVADPSLIPQRLDPSCSLLSVEQVQNALKRIDENSAFLSDIQKSEEKSLAQRARLVVAVDSAIKAKAYTSVVGAYAEYESVGQSTSTLFASHFKERTEVLNKCIENSVKRIPGSDALLRIFSLTTAQLDLESPDENKLNSTLAELATFAELVSDKELAYISVTEIFQRALARIKIVENVLYSKYYRYDVVRLQGMGSRSEEGDSLASALEQKLSRSACEKCISETKAAVIGYKNRVLTGQIAELESIRTKLLADAAQLQLELTAMASALEVLAGSEASEAPSIRAALAELDAATQAASNAPANPGQLKPRLNELVQETDQGRELLQKARDALGS